MFGISNRRVARLKLYGSDVNDAGADFGAVVSLTLSSDVLAVGAAQYNVEVNAETSTTDDLTQITGLAVGKTICIRPASGDTITVKDGATLNVKGIDFTMNNTKDKMLLLCTAAGVFDELLRSSND